MRHLVIVGVLALAFATAFVARSQPLEYGFELHEFDPFFNYRATQYMVDNGIDAYYSWNDNLSWYPDGRDVSATSQVTLHMTAAALYGIFGMGSELYDFTIMFPVVLGSLAVIVMFALVRVIGGTVAGLVSAMLMAVSLPIILRGTAGWFKSEPLGLFYGLLGTYLFLSGMKTEKRPVAAAKIAAGGAFVAFSLSAWGGAQFFILPLGMFILCLPFVRRDHSFQMWAVPLFAVSLLGTSLLFERPGTGFVVGLGGMAIVGPTIYLLICGVIRRMGGQETYRRNCAILLAVMLVGGSAALAGAAEAGIISTPPFRYLNAINPFLVAVDPLVDSVSEHQSVAISQSFLFHSILMVFGGVGVWLLLDRRAAEFHHIKPEMLAFALIIGMFGVYISSAFIRLEVFGSVAMIILSSISISIIVRRLLVDSSKTKVVVPVRMGMIAGIAALLVIPLAIPGTGTLYASDGPPSILNGASIYDTTTNDWLYTYEWMRNNTPPDAVVGSWWDYGYWTQTLGMRASIADNATIDSDRIKDIAAMMISPPDEAHRMLQDLHADYFMIFVMAERIQTESGPLYILGGGGDESKKQWFIRIAGESVSRYIHSDGISGTGLFWDDTLLGMMTPYTPILYVDPSSGAQFTQYVEGTIPLYTKDIKYASDGDGPLRLVFASPSFEDDISQIVFGIFIYEVNPNY